MAGSPRGIAYALSAYGIWGLFPIYWKALEHVDVLEVVAHRIAWTVPFVALVLTANGGWAPVRTVLRTPTRIFALCLTTIAITLNWGIYIWAVGHERVLEASLGYYLSPILSVTVGFLAFRERLTRLQIAAVALAALGVLNEVFAYGDVPWAALGVGISFAIYGAVRKATPIDAPSGLLLETALLAPCAAAWMLWLALQGHADFLHVNPATDVLLVLGGAVTAIPLLFYVGAARRLPLSTLGLLFYLTPSLQFAVGIFVYGEPFPPTRAITFVLVWVGLVIFVLGSKFGRSIDRSSVSGVRS